MDGTTECPGEDAILDFVRGSTRRRKEIEHHLDGCEPCRKLVSELVQTSIADPRHETGSSPSMAVTEIDDQPRRSRPLEPGARVGRYTIVDVRGAGGMGVVYAAHDPDLDRKIAMKLLRSGGGATSTEGRARLQREAQAMARLTHPNVISVHEVGVVDGVVFIAMELIEGGTVTRWLRAAKRSWREILDVYLAAGRGLAAAHAKGLVHRDFKPDNVLRGDDGRVRVTDFGLAARADDTEAELGGTPAYMAPEQHAGAVATARSDQFSFCVSLYEALWGERPFAGTSVAELRESVTAGRVRPPPPGTSVPPWIRRAVLRGLAVDPAERWPGMEDLLDALSHDPAVRRRRILVAVSAALTIAALAVAVWSVQSSRRAAAVCKDAGTRLAGVWDDGRKDAVAKAFAATGKPYAADAQAGAARALDRYAAEWTAMRTSACEATRRGEQSGEVLDLRMACLDRRLAELDALARLFSEADAALVERAVVAAHGLTDLSGCADREGLLAGEPPKPRSEAAVEIARIGDEISRARALLASGRFAEARELAERQLEPAKKTGHGPLVADVWLTIGRARVSAGAYAAGMDASREAAWAAEAARADRLAATAWSDHFAIAALGHAGADRAAELERQAATALARLGGDALLEASLIESRAMLAERKGDLEAALAQALEAKAAYERAIGDAHLAQSEALIATIQHERGEYADAERRYLLALEHRERELGSDHPDVARSLAVLATTRLALGRWDEAIAGLERAVKVQERALGPDHSMVGSTYHNLATTLENLGRHEEALAHAQRALAIWEKTHGPDHERCALALGNAANAMMALMRHAEARPLVDRALAIIERTYGRRHKVYAQLLIVRGTIEQVEEQLDLAGATFRESLSILEEVLGKDHPDLAIVLANLGELEIVREDWPAAMRAFERSIAIEEAAVGKDHPGLSYALSGLGRALIALGRPAEAIAPLERAVALRATDTADPYYLADARFRLGMALWDARRDRKRARVLVEQARAALAAMEDTERETKAAADWLRRHR